VGKCVQTLGRFDSTTPCKAACDQRSEKTEIHCHRTHTNKPIHTSIQEHNQAHYHSMRTKSKFRLPIKLKARAGQLANSAKQHLHLHHDQQNPHNKLNKSSSSRKSKLTPSWVPSAYQRQSDWYIVKALLRYCWPVTLTGLLNFGLTVSSQIALGHYSSQVISWTPINA
jgi:hypothetical protein